MHKQYTSKQSNGADVGSPIVCLLLLELHRSEQIAQDIIVCEKHSGMHDVVDQQRIRPNKDCTFSVGHRLRRLPSHITDPSLIGDLFVSFAVACGFIGGGVAVHFGEARADQMDCNVQESPEPKKPCKGILKTSSSFDKHSVSQ